MAVVKNNAYGLGLDTAGPILESFPEISGFAVVKAEAAIALREAGIRKPVLLMAMFSESDGPELVSRDIQLSFYTDDVARRVAPLARRFGRAVTGHVYLDTGMGRMGMPYHRALPWITDLAARDEVKIEGTFMAFTEEREFDLVQLERFTAFIAEAQRRGVNPGLLHAASSNGVFHLPEAHLDLVRPGIALYGAYPSEFEIERQKAELRPAFALKARVVRIERLREGDSVSYGRNYVADSPTWIATLPVGHVDGYPRRAVEGGHVLIGGRLYPVIGAVSASHSIVEIGAEQSVRLGDRATFVGSDHPALQPNTLAESMGGSVYDVLMHLNPTLPKVVVEK
jgi:alanine racemase